MSLLDGVKMSDDMSGTSQTTQALSDSAKIQLLETQVREKDDRIQLLETQVRENDARIQLLETRVQQGQTQNPAPTTAPSRWRRANSWTKSHSKTIMGVVFALVVIALLLYIAFKSQPFDVKFGTPEAKNGGGPATTQPVRGTGGGEDKLPPGSKPLTAAEVENRMRALDADWEKSREQLAAPRETRQNYCLSLTWEKEGGKYKRLYLHRWVEGQDTWRGNRSIPLASPPHDKVWCEVKNVVSGGLLGRLDKSRIIKNGVEESKYTQVLTNSERFIHILENGMEKMPLIQDEKGVIPSEHGQEVDGKYWIYFPAEWYCNAAILDSHGNEVSYKKMSLGTRMRVAVDDKP